MKKLLSAALSVSLFTSSGMHGMKSLESFMNTDNTISTSTSSISGASLWNYTLGAVAMAGTGALTTKLYHSWKRSQINRIREDLALLPTDDDHVIAIHNHARTEYPDSNSITSNRTAYFRRLSTDAKDNKMKISEVDTREPEEHTGVVHAITSLFSARQELMIAGTRFRGNNITDSNSAKKLVKTQIEKDKAALKTSINTVRSYMGPGWFFDPFYAPFKREEILKSATNGRKKDLNDWEHWSAADYEEIKKEVVEKTAPKGWLPLIVGSDYQNAALTDLELTYALTRLRTVERELLK